MAFYHKSKYRTLPKGQLSEQLTGIYINARCQALMVAVGRTQKVIRLVRATRYNP